MSEFAVGVFCTNDDLESLELRLQDDLDWSVEPVNEKWSMLISEDQWFIEDSTLEALLEFSKEVPLLYFLDAEDHEWGYKILHGGKVVASYSTPHGELRDVQEKTEMGIAQFQLFDVDEDVSAQLQAILLNPMDMKTTWEQVEEFKDVLV